MRPEFIISIVLAVLVASGVGYLVFAGPSTPPSPEEVAAGTATSTDSFIEKLQALTSSAPSQTETTKGQPYVEIANPSGFVNTDPITIKQFIGKKVILIDFMTYSCINCQRTFPYVTAWYNKYMDDGLIVIGIHTPEFAFEKDISNVRDAMKKFGITYPVVLDNDYGTWRAFANSYWPRKYLIDIHGNIVYDHAGEGQYAETEAKIRELLQERAEFLKQDVTLGEATQVSGVVSKAQSPETYFGSSRNEYLANGDVGRAGTQSLTIPGSISLHRLYLGGDWNVVPEYATASKGSVVKYRYVAGEVYIVAKSATPVAVEVWQDGKRVSTEAGADVVNGTVQIRESRLYKLIKNQTPGEHVLELRVQGTGAELYAFTFG